MKKVPPQTNQPSKSKRFWQKVGLATALLAWAAASTIAAQLVVGWIMTLILGSEQFAQPVWRAVYSAIAYSLAVLLSVFVPHKLIEKWRTNRNELGLKGTPTWTDIGLAPVGFIVAALLSALLVALFSLFPWFDAAEAQDVGFNILNGPLERIVAFLALVIIAPIGEEIIFRGWLYGKIRQIMPMPIAILLVSLLFAILHGQWNVGVNVFALSIVLCGLREVTGTIYAGILTHMIKNGIAFFLLYMI